MWEVVETAEVVYASRFLEKSNIHVPLLKMLGNIIISTTFNILFKQNITDLYTGFKVLRRSALKGINLSRDGFEHVLEMGVQFANKGIPIDEIHVNFRQRHKGRSKMKHFTETVKFIYLIIFYFIKSKTNKYKI